MKNLNKRYICVGYNFRSNNGHLLGEVGNVRSIKEWVKVAFPNKDESLLESFFTGYSDKDICKYLHENMAIRLELE